jgi:hypothetical protein
MQYMKMMPVFGIFIGLTLSHVYPRLFVSGKEKKMPARAGREKVKPKAKPAPAQDEAEAVSSDTSEEGRDARDDDRNPSNVS